MINGTEKLATEICEMVDCEVELSTRKHITAKIAEFNAVQSLTTLRLVAKYYEVSNLSPAYMGDNLISCWLETLTTDERTTIDGYFEVVNEVKSNHRLGLIKI